MISSAELMMDDQEHTLKELLEGRKIKKKEDFFDLDMKFLEGEDVDLGDLDIDIDIDFSDDDKPAKKAVPKRETVEHAPKKEVAAESKGKSKGELSNIFSLKALDEYLS